MVRPSAPADQQAQEAARDAAHEVAAAGMMNMVRKGEKRERNPSPSFSSLFFRKSELVEHRFHSFSLSFLDLVPSNPP